MPHKNFFGYERFNGNSTVVEFSPRQPEVEGSSKAAGTVGEYIAKNVTAFGDISLRGAATFSIMTLGMITLNVMRFSIKTLGTMIIGIMSLNIMTLGIITLSRMTLVILTLGILTLNKMTLSIKALRILTLGKMTLGIKSLGIINLT